MKTFGISILMAVVALVSLGSCRRASDNGKIDGLWKIQEIYYIADGTTVEPEQEFIGIQLELFQLQAPNPSPDLTGVLSYKKGADSFTVDFRNKPASERLYKFGFADKESVVGIERLDGKRLVLSTSIARISCRKW